MIHRLYIPARFNYFIIALTAIPTDSKHFITVFGKITTRLHHYTDLFDLG